MIGIGRDPETTRRPIGLLACRSFGHSATVVYHGGETRRGHQGVISLMQLYIFISVQILPYLTLNICTIFFTSEGGGQAQAP